MKLLMWFALVAFSVRPLFAADPPAPPADTKAADTQKEDPKKKKKPQAGSGDGVGVTTEDASATEAKPEEKKP